MNGNKQFSLAESFRFSFYTLIEHFAYYLSLIFAYLGAILVGSIAILSAALLPYSGKIIELAKVLENAGVPRTEMALNIARQLGFDFIIVLSVALTAIYLLYRYLALGLSKVALNFYDKKPNNISVLFSQYPLIVKDAIAAFLYWLMAFIGFLFLVVPGLYLIITFGFYHLFIVDQKVGVVEAFKKSAALTHGAKWQLLALMVLISLINYMVSMVFTVMLMWPFITLIYAYVYRELQAR